MANNSTSAIPCSNQISLSTEPFEGTFDTTQQTLPVNNQLGASLSTDVPIDGNKSAIFEYLSPGEYEIRRPSKLEIRGTYIDLRDNRLEQKIYEILQKQCFLSNIDTERFLPRCALQDILCHDVVKFLLRHKLSCEENLDEIADHILGKKGDMKYIQIFAILVLIEKTKYIQHFISAEICDEDLPLEFEDLRQRFPSCKTARLDAFYRLQWEVLIPVFDFSPDKIRREKFRSQVRMPFEHRSSISNGGHGRIIKVRIHHSHLGGYSSENYDFAIKQFETTDNGRDMWENEIDVFERFSGSNVGHKHLAKLLQAYEHVGIGYFLVFPLAKGSLVDYWEHSSSCFSSPNDAKWVIEQCLGIAAALCKIHHHNSWKGANGDNLGRHGDIKPENILWFKDSAADHGSLVLGDFTLTRFHSATTVNITAPGDRGFTQTYRPPEVEMHSKTRFAQSYDVWSLGCVYLEFLTWYLLGYTATRGQQCQSFVDIRVNDDDRRQGTAEDKFFKFDEDNRNAFVKESVKMWIRLLHSSQHCSKAIHALLDLVEKKMLVVNPKHRGKMEKVRKKLEKVLDKCSNTEYCYSGVPFSNKSIKADIAKFAEKPSNQLRNWHTSASRESILTSASTFATKRVMQQLENLVRFGSAPNPLDMIIEEESHDVRTGEDEESSSLQSPVSKDSSDNSTPTSITYPGKNSKGGKPNGSREPRRSIMSDEVRLLPAGTGTDARPYAVAPWDLRTVFGVLQRWGGNIRTKVRHIWDRIIVSIKSLYGGIDTHE